MLIILAPSGNLKTKTLQQVFFEGFCDVAKVAIIHKII